MNFITSGIKQDLIFVQPITTTNSFHHLQNYPINNNSPICLCIKPLGNLYWSIDLRNSTFCPKFSAFQYLIQAGLQTVCPLQLDYSLSITLSRFIHVVACRVRNLFLFTGYTLFHPPLLMNSWVLSTFIIVNNASLCWSPPSFLWAYWEWHCSIDGNSVFSS